MSTDRYGIVLEPPGQVDTADNLPAVIRRLGTHLADDDQDTGWTVIDLATGDQIGGVVDGRHGLSGLLTLLADVAALLTDPLTAPRTPYDLWVGHLLPQEISDLGLPVPAYGCALTP